MSVTTVRADHSGGFIEFLAQLAQELRAAIAASNDYRQLETKSDAQLARLGLVREDLPRVVFQRHFR